MVLSAFSICEPKATKTQKSPRCTIAVGKELPDYKIPDFIAACKTKHSILFYHKYNCDIRVVILVCIIDIASR